VATGTGRAQSREGWFRVKKRLQMSKNEVANGGRRYKPRSVRWYERTGWKARIRSKFPSHKNRVCERMATNPGVSERQAMEGIPADKGGTLAAWKVG